MFGLHKSLNPLDAGITIGVSPSPEAVGTVKQCKTARPPISKLAPAVRSKLAERNVAI